MNAVSLPKHRYELSYLDHLNDSCKFSKISLYHVKNKETNLRIKNFILMIFIKYEVEIIFGFLKQQVRVFVFY